MQELLETSIRLTGHIGLNFKRYLFNRIAWRDRLIEINGSRGTGKTTLMLQRVKELNSTTKGSALYVSLDDPYFFKNSISDLADRFQKFGGKFIFLDEVHKYPSKYDGFDWSAELKTIYDKFPDLFIIYSGSSILKLYKGQGDLSRRRSIYHLKGLSFREFLMYDAGLEFPPLSWEILDDHLNIATEITSQVKIFHYFSEYLKNGYYPFYKESPEKYHERLKDVLNVILETDIPSVADIPFETILKIKKLLGVIGSSVPYTPNLSNLRSELYITDQRTLLKYLNYLEKAEIINALSKKARGNHILTKPDKIYLNNTNLFQSLNIHNPEAGTVRETFFYNQVESFASVKYPRFGDFLLNDSVLIEVGGKNKSKNQIKGHAHSYLALDDIETGFGNSIPLWLFGFLY